MRLLLAEDNGELVDALLPALKQAGYAVDTESTEDPRIPA